MSQSPQRRVLDLGCGIRKVAGAIGADRVGLPGVDVVMNLDVLPYPFHDSSFDIVYCRHVLEHLVDWIAALREIDRILRPAGRIIIHVPYFASSGSFRDPTHKHFFAFETFDYFTVDGSNRLSVLNYYYPDLRFQVRRRLVFGRLHRALGAAAVFNRLPHVYEDYFCYFAPAREIVAELTTLKTADRNGRRQ